MRILFKSKEKTIKNAALKWYVDLNFKGEITYSSTLPKGADGFAGSTLNNSSENICAFMVKEGHTYVVFHHREYGIVIARKVD